MMANRLIWKIILDFIILAGGLFALLSMTLWAKPYERGYFENDESLLLPYKENTVSVALLVALGLSLNIVTILIVEIVRDKQNKGIGEKFLGSTLMPGWLWESYITIGVFGFGVIIQQLTTKIAKYSTGRLRPHFFDLCNPIPINTTSAYKESFTCANILDDSTINDMRLSFPSAHSSFAMYAAVFFALYIQEKAKWRGSKLLRHLVQFAVLLGAWYVGLSRVVDHMHHWSDVAVGYLIGGPTAYITFYYILKPKKYSHHSWHEPEPATNVLPRPVLAPQISR